MDCHDFAALTLVKSRNDDVGVNFHSAHNAAAPILTG